MSSWLGTDYDNYIETVVRLVCERRRLSSEKIKFMIKIEVHFTRLWRKHIMHCLEFLFKSSRSQISGHDMLYMDRKLWYVRFLGTYLKCCLHLAESSVIWTYHIEISIYKNIDLVTLLQKGNWRGQMLPHRIPILYNSSRAQLPGTFCGCLLPFPGSENQCQNMNENIHSRVNSVMLSCSPILSIVGTRETLWKFIAVLSALSQDLSFWCWVACAPVGFAVLDTVSTLATNDALLIPISLLFILFEVLQTPIRLNTILTPLRNSLLRME